MRRYECHEMYTADECSNVDWPPGVDPATAFGIATRTRTYYMSVASAMPSPVNN